MKHSARAHAILSASGASRWINCPPSARLGEAMGDGESSASDYAREGTLAHEIAEVYVYQRMLQDADRYLPEPIERAKAINATRQLKRKRQHELYDPEMEDYARDFVEYLWGLLDALPDHARIYSERRVDFSAYVPEGFGTVDITIDAAPTLLIVDYKYGRGVRVHADDNDQLRCYGLGAYLEREFYADYDTLVTGIYQPRLHHVDTAEISLTELLTWAEQVAAPAAQLAWRGEGEYQAGSHCRWCPARGSCATYAAYAVRPAEVLADADYQYSPDEVAAALLDPEKLAEVYAMIPELEQWIKEIKDFVYQEALAGRYIPGWKLVEKKGRRTWSDETAVVAAFEELGLDPELYLKTKPVGITDTAKLTDKETFERVFDPLIVRPDAQPSLVPADDPRPDYHQRLLDLLD